MNRASLGAHHQPDLHERTVTIRRPVELVPDRGPHWSYVYRNVAVGTAAILLALILAGGLYLVAVAGTAIQDLGNNTDTTSSR